MIRNSGIRVLLPLLLVGMILPNTLPAAEVLRVVPVVASVVDETVVAGIKSGNEGEIRNVNPLPKDLSGYLPMPIPFPTKQPATAQGIDSNLLKQIVSYNPKTGKETVLNPATVSGPVGSLMQTIASSGRNGVGSLGIDAESRLQNSLETFTDITAVGNTEEYPWRVLTKVFMTFPNGNYVCSGTLIQPSYAITAGHCVNNGSGGAWASQIVVTPGYRDNWAPYGSAASGTFLSFAGWTTYGDFNYDIGVVALDRPIGSATGWHAFGYTTDHNFYLATLFNNGGYPAQSEYGFNGNTLFYRYGYNDGYYSDLPKQVYFLKPSWGGQSGSSEYVYYTDTGVRVVYAILSISDRQTITGLATMDEAQFNAIRNWTGASAPASVDLTPLYVSAKAIGASDSRQMEMTYLAHNTSSAAWNGTVNANVYISDNENISPSDTLIQRHTFDASFVPWSSVEVTVPLVSIPESVAPGTYYLGVILDFDDANRVNNDSDGQDAGKIVIEN
ncbi:MAG: hypothetical protein COS92_01255 [Desulfobacterales bacterium CG07_land_8_20_14_0_80_52_14]|nr:MAG: hypothetical protein COS92_01255 [Desulfobacterales bacterium CG07_land_8_20_14_0_80_52_14]